MNRSTHSTNGSALAMSSAGKSLRRSFTLIELLAATLLAALLMAAVLGVLKGITRGQKALLSRESAAPWQARLINQLEWDLANSRSVVPTQDGFQLTGFAGRDFASGAALHGPTTIVYAVRKLAGQMWLVRSEAHLDSLNLDNDSLELVCNHTERIDFTSQDKQGSKGRDELVPQTKKSDDSPLPDQPVVVLYGTGQEKPIFEHAFVLR